MGIPSRVKEAAAEAEKLEAEEMARIAEAEEAERKAQEQAEADQQTQETTGDTQTETQVTTDQPESSNGQTVEVETLKADNNALKAELDKVLQQYRTAQGMLSKRESDKDELIKAMRERLDAMEKRMDEPSKPKEDLPNKYLKPDEIKQLTELGEDPLEVRKARGEIEAAKAEFDKKLEAYKAKIDEIERKDAEKAKQAEEAVKAQDAYQEQMQFYGEVEKAGATGFASEDTNPDSNWVKFLNLRDPLNVRGGPYRVRAYSMYQSGNAKGVAELFAEYKAMSPSGGKVRSLESQVKPDTSKASATPKDNTKAEHSEAELKAFYDNKLAKKPIVWRGKVYSKPEDIAAYQVELDEWYQKQQMAGR